MASARGRLPGIVHDRSGSGQTVFVEPLELGRHADLFVTACFTVTIGNMFLAFIVIDRASGDLARRSYSF